MECLPTSAVSSLRESGTGSPAQEIIYETLIGFLAILGHRYHDGDNFVFYPPWVNGLSG